ncbi:hypothetical protein BSZ19_21820 [Bradyrhizobium japonicum]|uniref:Uncharacterized protein n=1 Tax=Bradyrhizobium japonicum TaxID=375 RepID=A0A1Y2JM13_BRAJP|nr:hypothetical protein [Bradyrhizobium japonicum]OSJ31525.1 hypothetical protein BSZ19_21820 [Bradyrhizobium japonicum]
MADDNNNIRFSTFLRVDPSADELENLWKHFGPRCYRLVWRTPVPIENRLAFGKVFADRRLEITKSGIDPWRVAFTDFGRSLTVSTVFLGLDHRFVGEGPPLLFETIIFGGEHDLDLSRTSTWEGAEAMHARTVEQLRSLKVVK